MQRRKNEAIILRTKQKAFALLRGILLKVELHFNKLLSIDDNMNTMTDVLFLVPNVLTTTSIM